MKDININDFITNSSIATYLFMIVVILLFIAFQVMEKNKKNDKPSK